MHKLLKQRVVVIWIAMLGVLFGALAPTISHAMAAAAPAAEEVQLCTMEGMVTVAVDQPHAAKSSTPAFDHIFNHCPYCAMHGAAHALPPVPAFVFPISRQADTHPPLFYQSATPLFAWTAARPRAPPALI